MKQVSIIENLFLKSADNKVSTIFKTWETNRGKGVIVSIQGTYTTGMEIFQHLTPIFESESETFIIDFSNFKYEWGDRFFDWYYYLKKIYIYIGIESFKNVSQIKKEKMIPVYPENKIVLVVSELCKDGIVSLIEDEGLNELKELCFDSVDEAIEYIQ